MSTISLLWFVTRQHPWTLLVNLTLQIARTVLLVFTPLLVSAAFDQLEEFQALTTDAMMLAVGIAVLGIIRVIVVIVANGTEAACKALMVGAMTRSAMRTALQLPGAAPLPLPLSSIMSRLSGDTPVLAQQAVQSIQIASNSVQVVIVVYLMWQTDPILSASLLVPVLLAAIVTVCIRRRTTVLYTCERITADRSSELVSAAVKGAVSIQGAGTQKQWLERLQRYNSERRVATVRSRFVSEICVLSSLHFTTAIGVGSLMTMAALGILDRLSAGDLILFMSFLAIVLSFVATLGQYAVDDRISSISADRLEDALPGSISELHQSDRMLPESGDDEYLFRRLSVEGLTYIHPDTGKGIRDISFDVSEGQLVVIVGQVGSGKTTLLRALVGLLEPQTGRVSVNGNAASVLRPPLFSYTPQQPSLAVASIEENVLLGVRRDQEQLQQTIWTSNLDGDVTAFEQGLDTVVGGSQDAGMSGGQVQRTAAARMLAREPQVIIVDDPSSALDRTTEQTLWSRMLNAAETTTCIASSSQLWLVQAADQVIVLNDGRVEALGKWTEIRDHSVTLRQMFDNVLGNSRAT